MEFLFAHSGLAIGLLGAGLAACLAPVSVRVMPDRRAPVW